MGGYGLRFLLLLLVIFLLYCGLGVAYRHAWARACALDVHWMCTARTLHAALCSLRCHYSYSYSCNSTRQHPTPRRHAPWASTQYGEIYHGLTHYGRTSHGRIRRLKCKPGPDAIPHLEMWKDLPFLVRVRRPRAPKSLCISPVHLDGSMRRHDHPTTAIYLIWLCLPWQDGVVFSVDTIKSKARPTYQNVL